MEIVKTCPFCGNTFIINLPADCVNGYYEWLDGKSSIQDAMPTLPAVTRECLISGICPTCQDKFFGMD